MSKYVRDCSVPQIVRIDPDTGEELIVSSGLDALGRELPDDVPTAPPLGYVPGMTLQDMIRRMIQGSVSARAEELGMEDWDEANDFDIEDELDPGAMETVHQFSARFDPKEHLAGFDPDPAALPPAPVSPAPTEPSSSVQQTGKGSAEGGGPQATPPTPAPAAGLPKGT